MHITVSNVAAVSSCESAVTTSGCNNSVGESADSDCENMEPELAPAVRGHYKHFTRKQKLAVKEYAKMHGIKAAAKHIKVPKSTANNWNKTEFHDDNLRNRKNSHLQKSGRPLTYDQEIGWLILAHVLEQRDLQIPVTMEDICIHARELVKPVSPRFQASNGWVAGFMKRHDLSLHTKTSLAQRLPKDLEEKIESFHKFVVQKRKEDEFDDNLIINMDVLWLNTTQLLIIYHILSKPGATQFSIGSFELVY